MLCTFRDVDSPSKRFPRGRPYRSGFLSQSVLVAMALACSALLAIAACNALTLYHIMEENRQAVAHARVSNRAYTRIRIRCCYRPPRHSRKRTRAHANTRMKRTCAHTHTIP